MTSDTSERILDAADRIIRRDGLARATTRLIAREAGCSEALLYKYFPDKQDLFLRVLAERVPRIAAIDELVGQGTVRENLHLLTAQLLSFYDQTFPMAASIFSDAGLLAAHREKMRARGVGPHVPVSVVTAYIEAEQRSGRLPQGLDAGSVARLLVGAALHEAFLASYDGAALPDPSALAVALVAAVLPDQNTIVTAP